MFDRQFKRGYDVSGPPNVVQMVRTGESPSSNGAPVLTVADIEAEYTDALASISPKQLWAMQLYGLARALVAAERGSILAGTPEELSVARDMLFRQEADRRNAEAVAAN